MRLERTPLLSFLPLLFPSLTFSVPVETKMGGEATGLGPVLNTHDRVQGRAQEVEELRCKGSIMHRKTVIVSKSMSFERR